MICPHSAGVGLVFCFYLARVKTVTDETRMELYFPLVMQRSRSCPIFMAGDSPIAAIVLPTVPHHPVHHWGVIIDSVPAKCNLDQFGTLPALSKAAALRVTERDLCLTFWHHLPALSFPRHHIWQLRF